ncbi:MAG TPA: DnaT-like ssDNA-binding domain-containing protein [Micropruina sp.]|nr:DnaT-like ssDNA-binding domain-containing protein [Micropruina sp.]HMR20981.1 DnaT-like ssDNA-binding domain-containing protein [Micropruina sp.]
MTPRKQGDLFARFSLEYAEHPKIERLSDAAFRAHVMMILYARRYLTDGRIPNRAANRIANQLGFGSVSDEHPDVLEELLTNDPDHPSLVRLGDGDYMLHGYADHQETRAEVEGKRLARAANGRLGGRPRKLTETKTEPSGKANGNLAGKLTETEKKAETETETDTGSLRSPGGSGGKISPSAAVALAEHSATADAAPPTKRGTRLDPDWQPDRTDANLRSEAGHPTDWLSRELERFRDYWKAKTGKDATKIDWNATWRNWIRNAEDRQPPTPRARTAGSITEAEWQAMAIGKEYT